jgi:hypothetical protein
MLTLMLRSPRKGSNANKVAATDIMLLVT